MIAALAFGPDLPPQGERVTLRLGDGALSVERPDGRAEAVTYHRLGCRTGGWHGEGLVLEWTEGRTVRTVAVTDPEALASLRTGAPPALRARLALFEATLGRHRRARRLWIGVGLALGTGAVLFAIWLAGLAGRLLDATIARVPPATEEALGRAALAELRDTAPPRREGPATEAVRRIGETLAARVDSPYALRFHLLESPQVNARALPGGTIVVFTGLVRAAESAEEVAGVLAHEVQHVVRRHALRRVVRSLGWSTLLGLLLGGDGLARQAAEIAGQLTRLRFSRAQEAEADREGVRLLQRAGMPPEGMASFFERLARDGAEVPAFLSTHPGSADRAHQIRAMIGEQAAARRSLEVDWPRVRLDLQVE